MKPDTVNRNIYPVIVMDCQKIPPHMTPARLMKDLGITYSRTAGLFWSSMIEFFNCENIPEELPAGLTLVKHS